MKLPGVFHGRCAAAFWPLRRCNSGRIVHGGPLAKPDTVIGVEVSNEDENLISMTRSEEMNYAALTIQRGWRWTRKRIVLWGRKRGAVAREVAGGPATPCGVFAQWGASAKKKTESLNEMKSTLKAVEKVWRMLFNEELANLELDFCVRSRRVEW